MDRGLSAREVLSKAASAEASTDFKTSSNRELAGGRTRLEMFSTNSNKCSAVRVVKRGEAVVISK